MTRKLLEEFLNRLGPPYLSLLCLALPCLALPSGHKERIHSQRVMLLLLGAQKRMDELLRLEAQSGELLEPLKDPPYTTPSTTVEGFPPGLKLQGILEGKEDEADSDDDPDFDAAAPAAGNVASRSHSLPAAVARKGPKSILKKPSQLSATAPEQQLGGNGQGGGSGQEALPSSSAAPTGARPATRKPSIIGEVVEREVASVPDGVGAKFQGHEPDSNPGQPAEQQRVSRFKMRRHPAG